MLLEILYIKEVTKTFILLHFTQIDFKKGLLLKLYLKWFNQNIMLYIISDFIKKKTLEKNIFINTRLINH